MILLIDFEFAVWVFHIYKKLLENRNINANHIAMSMLKRRLDCWLLKFCDFGVEDDSY